MLKTKRRLHDERKANDENQKENDKLTWLTCSFKEGFTHVICKASLILSWKGVEAVSRIEKQSSEFEAWQLFHLFEFLSVVRRSRTGVTRYQLVSPT